MPRGEMNYRNAPPAGKLPADATSDQVKVEFARRLQAEMAKHGWNQSDLVIAAKRYVPDGKTIAAYDISNYIRGRSLPRSDKLEAVAKALGVSPAELLPHRGMPEVQRAVSPLQMRQDEDGNVWLKMDRVVSYPTALKIMALLSEEDAPYPDRRVSVKIIEENADGTRTVTRGLKEDVQRIVREELDDLTKGEPEE